MSNGFRRCRRYRKGKRAQHNAARDEPVAACQRRGIITHLGRALFASVCASAQAVEHGVEQGVKARAMTEPREDGARLLFERAMADFVGSTFQQRLHAVLSRLHVKL